MGRGGGRRGGGVGAREGKGGGGMEKSQYQITISIYLIRVPMQVLKSKAHIPPETGFALATTRK